MAERCAVPRARVALDYDPRAATACVAAADPALARVIARIGECTLHHHAPDTPFRALLRSIVHQQLAGRAAAAIHGRLLALYPRRLPVPRRVLATPDEQLRAAGLSRAKVAAVKDLAAKAVAGVVPDRARLARMDDEAIVARLTEVRGIGRWTVEMLLIFQLGRPDVLPLDDLGVRKGFARCRDHAELPERNALAAHGEAWRPYRSVASWYLWRATEL